MAEQDGHRPPALWPVLLGLGLLPLLLLWPTLVGERALVGVHTGSLSPWSAELPQDFVDQASRDSVPLTADKTIQFQPLLAASLDRLTQGEVPLWNPHNLGGVPLLAQAFQGALYPPSWLAIGMHWPRAFGWIAWLQAAMAGIFAAMLLSELGAGRRAAFLAGTTYMLCGYLSARWHWYQIHGCSALLPLALWGIERLCRTDLDDNPRARFRALAATTLTVAMAWLSGWLQGAIHLLYVGALWTVVRTFTGLRMGLGSQALAGAGRSAIALTLGLAIALPQIGPTLEYVSGGASARSVETPEVLRSVAMQPVALLALVAPEVFGHPRDLTRHELPQLRSRGALGTAVLDSQDNDNFVESASTIGIVALLLAALGASSPRRGRALGIALFLAGLVLALDTPLLLLVAHMPGLASGDPQRFLLLASLGGTILAGLGLQRLSDRDVPRWFIVLALAASTAAGAAAFWSWQLTPATFTELLADGLVNGTGLLRAEIIAHSAQLGFDLELMRSAVTRLAVLLLFAWLALLVARRRKLVGISALLLLAVGDQTYTGWRNASSVPLAHLFEAPSDLELLLDDDGGRMVRFTELGVNSPLQAPLPPNTGLPFGVSDLGGYWALAPRRMIEVFEGLEPGCTGNGLGQVAFNDLALLQHPALDLLAVTRVLSEARLDGPGLVPLGPVGDAWLAARPSALPRAWFTTSRAVAAPEEALAALLDPTADPAGPAPLVSVAGQAAPNQPVLAPGTSRPDVTFVQDLPEQIELAVEAPQAGVVVLADNWMPGWSATVDGSPATLWPAWHTLRAVVVPAGQHVVRMTYDSPAFRMGVLFSATALLVLVLLWRRAYRRAPTEAFKTG